MTSDEIVTRAADALQRADDEAYKWALGRTVPRPQPGGQPGGEDRVVIVDPQRHVVSRAKAHEHNSLVEALRSFLDDHPDNEVEVTWRVVQ